MSDPQMKEFAGRIRRIEKIHRRGGGFEAAGAIGQSHYTREQQRRMRRSALRPALIVLLAMVVFKGFLLASHGTDVYQSKVVELKAGSVVEQVGGFVMAIDPLSLAVSGWVAPLFN